MAYKIIPPKGGETEVVEAGYGSDKYTVDMSKFCQYVETRFPKDNGEKDYILVVDIAKARKIGRDDYTLTSVVGFYVEDRKQRGESTYLVFTLGKKRVTDPLLVSPSDTSDTAKNYYWRFIQFAFMFFLKKDRGFKYTYGDI